MAYQIFALKWRPQDFNQIVGQDSAINLLQNSIQKGRLAYAYLFAGPRGVGKTSTARILAKSLNCQNGPTIKPCQVCPACREITQCRSLDVLEIDGASNRGIDEVRALREGVGFAPSGGRFKIYIIDEVHMLTNEAFNALLKTLEEPPEFVKFIFATTMVNRIPATILSRCQRLDFRRIPVLGIINQLRKIVQQEKIKLEDEVIFTIARACDGSLRDAESILDQLASFTEDDKISIHDLSSLLGVLEQEILFDITDKIINKDAAGILTLLNAMLKQGKDNNVILKNIIEHFRNLIVAKVSNADSSLLDLPADIVKRLLGQSKSFSLQEIFNIFNLLVNTQEMSRKMDASIIPLEVNLIRLTQEKKTVAPISGQGRINKASASIRGRGAAGVNNSANTGHAEGQQKTNKTDASTRPHQAAKEAGIPASPSDNSGNETRLYAELKRNWSKVIDCIGKVKMSVATFLSEGIPLEFNNDILTISFPNNCSLHKDTLQRKENKLLIEKAISDFLNKNLKVRFTLSLAKDKEISDTDGQKNKSDSFINSAINIFNARLL